MGLEEIKHQIRAVTKANLDNNYASPYLWRCDDRKLVLDCFREALRELDLSFAEVSSEGVSRHFETAIPGLDSYDMNLFVEKFGIEKGQPILFKDIENYNFRSERIHAFLKGIFVDAPIIFKNCASILERPVIYFLFSQDLILNGHDYNFMRPVGMLNKPDY